MESEKCASEKEAKVCYTNSGFSIDISEIKEKEEITKNIPKEKENETSCRLYLGILLILGSAATAPLVAVFVKRLKNYDTLTLVLWRFLGMVIPSFLMALYHWVYKKELIFKPFITRPRNWRIITLLLIMKVGAVVCLICNFSALKYINIGDHKAIFSSKTFLVLFLAHLTLGEECGIIPTIAGIASLLGVCILARPPFLTGQTEFDENIMKGTLLSLGYMFAAVIINVLLRLLRTVHYTVIGLTSAIFGSLVSLVICGALGLLEYPQTLEEWWLAIGMSGASLVTQNLQYLAFKYEEAGVLSLVRSSELCFAYGWQWLIFAIVPDEYSIIGAIIILLAIVLIGIRKFLQSKPKEDSLRGRFACLLL